MGIFIQPESRQIVVFVPQVESIEMEDGECSLSWFRVFDELALVQSVMHDHIGPSASAHDGLGLEGYGEKYHDDTKVKI